MKKNRPTYKHTSLWMLILFLSSLTGYTQTFSDTRQNGNEYLQGTIVIKLNEDVGSYDKQEEHIAFGIPSLDEKARKYKITLLEKRFKHKPIAKNSGLPDLSRIYRIEFSESQNVHQVAKEFAHDPNIEYAEAVPVYHAAEMPDDPMYGSQQHLPQIMASEAWDVHKGEDGEEVIIAIIDTGVDWLHPDLTENCWQNMGEDADGDGVTLEFNNGVWERDPDDLNGIDDDGNGFIDDVIGWDFYEQETIGDGSNPDPTWGGDGYEHGSHCAGIAAGRTNNGIGISSVSYNVKYMATQVDNGNDQFTHAWDAIIYAADNGADIISNSWGGPNYSEVGRETIEYAVGLGSIVVVAAHNYNTDTKYYPAAFPGSISISALNPDDTKASFTNYGAWLDIAAPGVSILSTLTNNSYASWGGTSMATPMVAGLFGLLKSYQPDWTNDQLIEQIIGTADDIDALNPGFENALGSGRINAYHALVGDDVEVPQELRLEFISYSILDEDADGNIEPGELCTMSVTMRNYAHLVSNENTTFLLSSPDPAIEFISGSYTGEVPPDSEFELENVFEFRLTEDASPHIADFILEVSSDLPVTYGNETEFAVLVAPAGFLVWEGEAGVQDYSGEFIRDFLEERGHDVFYSTTFPESFAGFDAVFLSYANLDEVLDKGTVVNTPQSYTMQSYLEDGGKLYVEGTSLFTALPYLGIPNEEEMYNLFGVEEVSDTLVVPNPINNLSGIDASINEGMVFTNSNQQYNWYINRMVPLESATVSFSEEDYGDVSIYNEGEYGQKTYYFSYSLAELVDVDPYSSRYNFLVQLMDFFGYPEEDGLVANFIADNPEGETELQVQFTDLSITDTDVEITSWAWDFNEDGEIDSFDQNPNWIYTTGGVFDVSLIVNGDGGETDTLVKKDFITLRKGILVYEGMKNANGYSGTFIADYLNSHFYDEVGYSNRFPASLDGYDAVFLSFGNTGLRSTEFTSQMSSALSSYSQSGGKIYLEGGDAIYSMNQSTLWVLGMDGSEDGEKNELTELKGMEDALTDGLEFSSTNQVSFRSIDTYSVYEGLPGAKAAFTESDYGIVAVEFDGTQSSGQKTFCMSYALADLEDGEGDNTRNELLKRIIDFFNVTVDVEEQIIEKSNAELKVFPNPVNDQLTLEFALDRQQTVVVEIFDITGRKITETTYSLQQGNHQFDYDVSDYPAGLMHIRLQIGERAETIKWIKVD